MGMPKNLFLVRHGESEGNFVRKQFEENNNESFFTDEFLGLHESQYELTEKGISQAKQAGLWLKENGFTHFDRSIVSNNVRALQTAGYLDLPQASWMIDFNVRERDGGLFNVLQPSQRDLQYADQQKFYHSQPFYFRPPQGESIADLCQRIKIVLDTLSRECDGQNVIIACHGHVIRAFRIILERLSLYQSNELLGAKVPWAKVPNCSILHYTRENVESPDSPLYTRFAYVRMVRPGGGGNPEDDFSAIIRKKYSNEELFEEAQRNRENVSPSV